VPTVGIKEEEQEQEGKGDKGNGGYDKFAPIIHLSVQSISKKHHHCENYDGQHYSPHLCLFRNAWHSLNGIEEASLLCRVLNVGVDEEGVNLRVDVLNGNLKAIETSYLRDLSS